MTVIASLRKLTGRAEADLLAEIEALREQERSYSRGVGRLAEDAHERLDACFQLWQEQLRSLVESGLPDTPHHPNFPVVAQLASMIQAVPTFHELLNEATAAGKLDPRPRAEVEGKVASFRKQIAARELALQRKLATEQVAAAQAGVDEIDDRAEKVLGA